MTASRSWWPRSWTRGWWTRGRLTRWWPRTLRGQLSLVALTTATLVMVILTVVFNTVVGRHLQQQADDELRTRAAAVATTVDTRHDPVRVLETPGDGLLDTNVWIYAGGRLLEQPPSVPAGSPVTRAAEALAARPAQGCVTVGADSDGGGIRLCAHPITSTASNTGTSTGTNDRAHTAAVVTALDLSPYRASADTLLLASLALDAAVLACTYVLTRLAVGRALRPVRTMTEQATRWGAVASDERFGGAGQPAELAGLGTSLDALLDRIRALLRHEQQLTRELSHELRNPLAMIIAELEWWRSTPRSPGETGTTHAAIADAARTMREICDTLLDDARGDAHTTPGATDVLPVLQRLAQRPGTPDHVQVQVQVHTHAQAQASVIAGVSPALLDRIVGPLLDNALRHARSRVVLRAVRRPDGDRGIRVEIEDDGGGVPASFLGELFQPGRRAEPGDGHGGAGLGLPLARRLARSAGGEVRYDEQHTPGARFVVTLPAG
ncbi:sensor histidine kinase [Streptomyces sp. NPDC091292]|uniref:sensor histidine kinase n=1 Tax=Streptomyces sp. NPDC091292 TaxID=3365991 RepID=UPI00380CAE4A